MPAKLANSLGLSAGKKRTRFGERTMHRRYDHANIPIEVLRTFITVNDASGNFSKTALALGLTQPAVSAQIKRLQHIVGKQLFEKVGNGIRLTDDGAMVLAHGRRIVAANDQLLLCSRPQQIRNQVRIGMPHWIRKSILARVIEACTAACPQGRVIFFCDRVERLTHDVCAGRLDMALLYDVATPPGLIYDEWWEQRRWVKSPRLTLQPGEPVPLITWPGTYSDRHAAPALNDAGIQYFVSFSAPELSTRITAAGAGLGVLTLSESRVPVCLEPFEEPHFPTMPAMRKGVYLQQSIDLASVERVARAFLSCVKMPTLSNVVSAKAQRTAHSSAPSRATNPEPGRQRAAK
jgi:DNA-binding transcriptional LysR family regulator